MTAEQELAFNIVYLSTFGGFMGGALFFIFHAVLEGLAELGMRSLERHRDRAGLVRACERLPGEGAQQHGKVGD